MSPFCPQSGLVTTRYLSYHNNRHRVHDPVPVPIGDLYYNLCSEEFPSPHHYHPLSIFIYHSLSEVSHCLTVYNLSVSICSPCTSPTPSVHVYCTCIHTDMSVIVTVYQGPVSITSQARVRVYTQSTYTIKHYKTRPQSIPSSTVTTQFRKPQEICFSLMDLVTLAASRVCQPSKDDKIVKL